MARIAIKDLLVQEQGREYCVASLPRKTHEMLHLPGRNYPLTTLPGTCGQVISLYLKKNKRKFKKKTNLE